MKNYFNLIIIFLFLIYSSDSLSQGSVGIGTTSPNTSAILDVESTTKGMLIPRMDSLQRVSINSPTLGLLVYETDTKAIWMWNGVAWEKGTRSDAIYSEDLGTSIKVENSGMISMVSNNDTAIIVNKNANDDYIIDIGGANRSIYIGEESGKDILSGNDNTGVGYYTFYESIEGFQNTAIGSYALFRNNGNYNTAIGSFSLSNNKKGWRNIAIGHTALQSLDTSDYNIALGVEALRYHIRGANNIAVGYRSAANDTFGIDNISIGKFSAYENKGDRTIAIGQNALRNNEADDNLAIGNESMMNNTFGTGNLAIGYLSMNQNTTGSNNLAIGEGALKNNVLGSNNIAIGKNAGQNETGSNKLYIENSAFTTPLIWGDFLNDSIKINGSLSIKDEYTFPIVDGTIGQTLKTDGIGNITWQDDSSSMELNDLSDAKSVYAQNNLFGGLGSGNSILPAGDNNTGWGKNALNSTTIGNDNTGVGQQALFSNLAGEWNTAVGTKALQNSNSDSNTAIGQEVLKANVSGFENTGVGAKALRSNVNGNRNTAVGEQSMENNESGSSNVAFGNNALQSNITGSQNISIGDSSMNKSTYGINNIAIGKNALQNSFGSDNSIALGQNALLNTGSSNNIGVGHFALENNISGVANSAFGYVALHKSVGDFNSAFGYRTLENTNSDRNTAFGSFAGYNVTSGRQNALFGSEAMTSNKTGEYNSVFGDQGLWSDTIGSFNTVMGSQALYLSVGSSNNTCVGYQAGYNTNGGGNVFLGHQAGYFETGGHYLYIDNTSTADPLIWGDFIGDSLTINGYLTSEQKFEAKSEVTVQGVADFRDLLFIRNADNSNYVVIDSSSISTIPSAIASTPADLWLQSPSTLFTKTGDVRLPTDTRLGIGTTVSPTHSLTVETTVGTNTVRLIGPGTNGAGSRMNFGDADFVYLDEPTDDHLRIQATRIGMLRNPVANALELEGVASKTTAGNWLANSDRRIKTNIREIENSFDVMNKLRPVTFNYTEEWKKLHPSIQSKQYYNFIAQEYGAVFPESIQGSGEYLSDDSEEILQIDTYDAQIVTIQAVKDLITENENLKMELDNLKTSMNDLRAELISMVKDISQSKE